MSYSMVSYHAPCDTRLTVNIMQTNTSEADPKLHSTGTILTRCQTSLFQSSSFELTDLHASFPDTSASQWISTQAYYHKTENGMSRHLGASDTISRYNSYAFFPSRHQFR